jgi:hypothetical protein
MIPFDFETMTAAEEMDDNSGDGPCLEKRLESYKGNPFE